MPLFLPTLNLHPWSQNPVCSPISGIVTRGCRMFLSTAWGWVILPVRQVSLPKHPCLAVTVAPLPFLWKYSSFRSRPQEATAYGQGESVIGWFSFDYETHVGQWGSSKGGSYPIIVLIKHLALRVEPLRSKGVMINYTGRAFPEGEWVYFFFSRNKNLT